MKYNSIGEQLIAKAKELDPNYKPDKFNDMSEALNIILNNSGSGSGSGSGDILDIGPYLIFNDGSDDKGIISQEGCEKLNSSSGKIIIANFRNKMFDDGYPFILEKGQEINGTVYYVFYGIELDFKSFKQHKKGILIINMDTKTFVADYENISNNLILPTISPSSQVIPSITTSNEQQNLTVGDGLIIENGTLKTTYSKRVFEPTINSVSISNDDTTKQITFNFSVSNFEILTYLTTLIENNKQFTETLYLKTPSYGSYQIMFNASLSLVNASTGVGGIYHCFNVIRNVTSEIKCIITYGENNMTLDIIFSSEEDYTGYKQLASALFTNDTKIKITVKTDE